MGAQEDGGAGSKSVKVEVDAERPLERAAERRERSGITADDVAISAGGRMFACVEPGRRLTDAGYPDVGRCEGTESAQHISRVPMAGELEADDLTECMDTGVRASGGMSRDASTSEALECLLNRTLYGAIRSLALPSAEAAAVVLEDGKVRHPGHGPSR